LSQDGAAPFFIASCPSIALSGGFYWADTELGYDFWEGVRAELRGWSPLYGYDVLAC